MLVRCRYDAGTMLVLCWYYAGTMLVLLKPQDNHTITIR